MHEPRQALHDLLLRELRAAVMAKNKSGADPRRVTADLEQRLRRIGDVQRDTLAHQPARTPESTS